MFLLLVSAMSHLSPLSVYTCVITLETFNSFFLPGDRGGMCDDREFHPWALGTGTQSFYGWSSQW